MVRGMSSWVEIPALAHLTQGRRPENPENILSAHFPQPGYYSAPQASEMRAQAGLPRPQVESISISGTEEQE
jgi:hypothetical protein